MMSPVYIRARASVRVLALLLALAAAWPMMPYAQAAALPVPAGLIIEQDDRNAILQWDFDPTKPGDAAAHRRDGLQDHLGAGR